MRDVVARIAPDELVIVEGLARLPQDTVVQRLSRTGRRQDPLGFGIGDVATLVTPVVWLMVNEAAKQAATSAVDSSTKATRTLLRRVLRRHPAPVVVPVLTRAQLEQVRSRVLETATQRGLGRERATAIADAVVTRLVLTGPEQERQPAIERADSERRDDLTKE